MCESAGRVGCEGPHWIEAREGAVWVDLVPEADQPSRWEDYEMRVDGSYFDRKTPAVEALLAEGAGAVFYGRADAWREMAVMAEGSSLVRRAGGIAGKSGADRVFEIRRARRDIADAMVMDDAHSPATREVEDLAVVARGDESGNLLFEAVQTYTRYGTQLAAAGDVETALPAYGLARPIVTGEWRYDLQTALERASGPTWMADPLLGESTFEGAWALFEETDGFVAFVAFLNHPLSTVAGAVDALKQSGAMNLMKPQAVGSMVAGVFSFDVDPIRVAEGRPGVTGGMALAVRGGAMSALEQMINVGQGALGITVGSEVEERAGFSLYKLRLDHDGTFTDSGEAARTRFTMRLHLDRLRAKIEMLGDQAAGWRGFFALGRFLEGVELTVEAADRYRYTQLRFGPYRGAELGLPEETVGPVDPEVRPSCLREAVRASKRVYVEAVDEGPYYPKRSRKPVRGPMATVRKRAGGSGQGREKPEVERPEPSAELGGQATKRIEELVGELGELETACGEEAGEDVAAEVGEIRAYWEKVLEGKVRTYPE